MTTENDVREASRKFYAALNRMAKGDAGGFAGIWAGGGAATAMHPIGGRDTGQDQVLASFGKVAGLCSGGEVKLSDQAIQAGSDMAYEIGVETGKMTMAGKPVQFEHRVTNVYRRDGGTWKIVHHHTDLSPGLLDIVAGLQPEKAG